MEQKFENTRFAMQEARLKELFASGNAKKGIAFEEARRLMWMYTSRDVYRMLVQEGDWTPDRLRGVAVADAAGHAGRQAAR